MEHRSLSTVAVNKTPSMSPCAVALLPIHAGATVLVPVPSYAIRVFASMFWPFVESAVAWWGGCADPPFVPPSTPAVKTIPDSLNETLPIGGSLSINLYVNLS
jgi:hypothetical protein